MIEVLWAAFISIIWTGTIIRLLWVR